MSIWSRVTQRFKCPSMRSVRKNIEGKYNDQISRALDEAAKYPTSSDEFRQSIAVVENYRKAENDRKVTNAAVKKNIMGGIAILGGMILAYFSDTIMEHIPKKNTGSYVDRHMNKL